MTKPIILFCRNPLDPRTVDPAYADEFALANRLRFPTVLVDHDYLDQDIDASLALGKQKLPEGKAVYRGWMMSYGAYSALHEALRANGVQLMTNPEEYRLLHYFAGHPGKAQKFMADSVEIPHPGPEFASEDDYEDWLQDHVLMELASVFGNDDDDPVPVVLKDYVKSQADYWEEACFIPDALDRDEVERVLGAFVRRQGGLTGVQGGFVFRRFIDFAKKPGRRATEYRAVIVRGKVVGCWPREHDIYIKPSRALLEEVSAITSSPFATADFAIDSHTGKWWLIEMGDGQVSSIPPMGIEAVFHALADI